MHGIILHEEYRGWLRKLSNEDLGKIVENMFRVDDGETPVIFNDDHLDFLSETLCNRMVRDIEKSDKQRANRLGKTKNNQTKTKNNQTKTKQEPKKTPITNNVLPITNNNIVSEILSYLNEKANRHYKTDTSGYISARLKEGYTVEDFKKVIDKKVSEWGNDPKWSKYLQPSTLFAPSHFDEYLNQPDRVSTAKPNSFTSGVEKRNINFDELEKKLIKN